MNDTNAVNVMTRTHVAGVLRMVASSAVALGLMLGGAGQAAGQQGGETRDWEFRISSGRVLPTGDQREAIEHGDMTAAQVAYVVRPTLAFTATLGWARSRDIVADHNRKLDVFTYDVGAEARAPDWFELGIVSLTPFAGAGAGARSYAYRRFDADATHNVAGYLSAGGVIGVGPVALRIEARNYVSDFRGLGGAGSQGVRNDVALIFGLGFER